MDNPSPCDTKWLLHGLRSLYEENRHCDVEICVEDEAFSCHKVVLSAASKYFDSMFSSGMKESTADTVRLYEIKGKTFAEVLDFIYTGSDVIKSSNVESLLHAACMLQISHFQHLCECFLIDQLSPGNAVGIWSMSSHLNCTELSRAAWDFILDKVEEIVQYDEFVRLEKTEFFTIIANDNLNVKSEESICAAAMRWVKAKESERNEFFIDVLKALKLTEISTDFLLEHIYSEPNIHKNPECMKILKDVVRYHALPEKRQTYNFLHPKPRKSSLYTSLYIMIGHRKTKDAISSGSTDILAYDSQTNKWYTFCPIPFEIGDEFASCPYGNDIYLSGGTAKPNSLYKFCSKQYKWMELAPLSHGRYRHCMVALRDNIFCLGGYHFGNVASIEEFDISSNIWQTVSKLKHPVDSASAVVHKDNIIIFGGWEGFSDETSAIQCFNTNTRACSVIGHLPSPQKDSKALSFYDKIYIVFSTGEVMLYEPYKSMKLVAKLDNFHRINFGLLKTQKSLLVIGGTVIGESELKDNSVMSDEIIAVRQDGQSTDNLTIKEPMPAGYDVYGYYYIQVRRKYPLVEFSEQFAW